MENTDCVEHGLASLGMGVSWLGHTIYSFNGDVDWFGQGQGRRLILLTKSAIFFLNVVKQSTMPSCLDTPRFIHSAQTSNASIGRLFQEVLARMASEKSTLIL